ncbi:1,2-dihydroxy-3-keto-5-methylthiopentene dioxygenase [Thoreauomyces humboldtii]|nr:1,2-dihydroxy-3-keto-5-methylthiopentene dioxygenase [Thoreauomyces humboldtii]
MVQAWFYNDADASDGRELHQYTPNRPVPLSTLDHLGVLRWNILPSDPKHLDQVDRICEERNYKNRDVITISKEKLPNYEAKLKSFFEEHFHEDEEIRYILEGSGYFDVRSPGDEWVRIALSAGEMIVLPAGIYHRFTLDSTNYLKAMRLFKEDPKWTPLNRTAETDVNPYRKEYVQTFLNGASSDPAR